MTHEQAEKWAPILGELMTKYEIEAPYRAAAFFANLRLESISLAVWSEIGGGAKRYAPWYGRGPIQLTHLDAYVSFSKASGIDVVSDPEALCDKVNRPEVGFEAACWFWTKYKGLNVIADQLPTNPRPTCDTITRRVNGAGALQNSLDLRWQYYQHALDVICEPTILYRDPTDEPA